MIADKLKEFNRVDFETKNEGFVEIMENSLKEFVELAITEGEKRYDALVKCYKKYYEEHFVMSPSFKEEFSRHAHTVKGHASLCYVDKQTMSTKNLQHGIDTEMKKEIDTSMYEAFAFKKIYFECLHAIKGELSEETEFDLK